MLELMMNVWGMDKPNLLISVTGGAKNFQMNKRLKETFRRGLMKAAQTTGDLAENKILFVCPLPTYPHFSPLLKKLYCSFLKKTFYGEMNNLGFIKSFKCLNTNLLNLPFLEKLCTFCEISIHLIHMHLYYMYM